MPTRHETLVEPVQGCRSPTVAAWIAALETQSQKLRDDIADLSVEELGWSPAPTLNTMGMLLAHIAVAEAHVTEVGLLGKPTSDLPAIIGIRMEDDGMPLTPGDGPPAALKGKDVAFFIQLLSRARAHLRAAAAPLDEKDLDRVVVRTRPDGGERVFNVRWAIYHALEHEAGHHGQILLLKHLRRGSGR